MQRARASRGALMGVLFLGLAVALLAGCEKDLGDPLPRWTALDDLNGEYGMRPVNLAVSKDEWHLVKLSASRESLTTAIDKFAAAPIPPEYQHKAADKEKAVKDLRALVEAAKQNSIPKIQAAYDQADDSLYMLESN